MTTPTDLTAALSIIVGATHLSTEPDVLAVRSVDWTGRYRGAAAALVRPGSTEEVAAVLRTCRDAGAYVTVQGGRTSLVAGTVPEHGDVLLSTERLTEIGDVDTVERQVRVGAGVTLAQVHSAASAAGLLFGVDLAARDSATIGGMAATNAGGLRTVRYGSMREQIVGLDVVLPDGSVLRRHPRVAMDNTGYDLTSLFVGSEGTLGVITGVDLRLHPVPRHRVTAVCGFDGLAALVRAGRMLREVETIAALELVDGRAAALAAEHLDLAAPVPADWLLLVELAGDIDPTDRLAAALDGVSLCGPPAVGVDSVAQQRLWQLREAMAEVVGMFGPPVKFDISLPLSAVASFASDAAALSEKTAPQSIPLLFGHIGEGNLHLNVLRCDAEQEAALYGPMMELIAAHGGNVSSEHGVGSRKRAYLGMARESGDIAAMRTVKAALDPTGYLNPAVLFD
ncbi:FAD-binding oxidoreductase [Mycolicibacterium sp.]|uniref:FAD-binding oxidoreductase n=1 Tax=Mycolicibacterium sp. TaxID=2320850 RepID=UPI0028A8673D|nr:FAD-binding oxidoreductase [Mycolicibacterium sp.]